LGDSRFSFNTTLRYATAKRYATQEKEKVRVDPPRKKKTLNKRIDETENSGVKGRRALRKGGGRKSTSKFPEKNGCPHRRNWPFREKARNGGRSLREEKKPNRSRKRLFRGKLGRPNAFKPACVRKNRKEAPEEDGRVFNIGGKNNKALRGEEVGG